jgi:hypothetical protein
MLHSGLLSLSVHEALTFEGTEIAIHPDLFADTTAGSITSSRHGHSVLVRPPAVSLPSSSFGTIPPVLLSRHERQTSDGTLSPSLLEHKEAAKLQTVTSESQLHSVAESHHFAHRRLEVGDMVEIRVWNAKTRGIQPGSGQKQRMQQPSSQGVGQVASSDSMSAGGDSYVSTLLKKPTHGSSSSIVKTTRTVLEAAASALKDPSVLKTTQGVASSYTTSSMQYSADSPSAAAARTPDSVASPKSTGGRKTPHSEAGDASTVSTVEVHSKEARSLTTSPKLAASPKLEASGIILDYTTTINGKVRSRSNSGDPHNLAQSHQHIHRPGKPPLVHRQNRAISAHRADALKSGKPAHFRDISDMTMDTSMLLGSTLIGHDDLMAAHSTDSHDDHHLHPHHGDDATLSKVAATHTMRLSIVMLVTQKTLTSLKGQARSQISMLRQGKPLAMPLFLTILLETNASFFPSVNSGAQLLTFMNYHRTTW